VAIWDPLPTPRGRSLALGAVGRDVRPLGMGARCYFPSFFAHLAFAAVRAISDRRSGVILVIRWTERARMTLVISLRVAFFGFVTSKIIGS
jgi:hypothetical protein